ncbi:MAG: disulfide bond formation protein B [Alphaproteobacteria bacterium]|nr:disulfide bond formation protein B [Alphaproteobacteria bacterium]
MNKTRFKNKPSEKILLGFTLICIGILATAYIMEHVFGVLPCQMCLYERDIFMVVGAFSFLSFFLIPARYHSSALIILGFIFMGGALFAGYHVAIQQHWVSLPAFCASNQFSDLNSIESLRDQMLKTPLVRCDQVTWSLFGLSLAAYNAILSFVLAITCWTWIKRRK